jgi:ABC-2 type transport system permease protein
MLLSGAFATLMTVSLLWTISGEGISRVLPTLSWILSGIMVPIPLFPDWAQTVLLALPFRGLADTPFRIYVGHITPAEALPAIAHQLVWAAVFIAVGRWMVLRGQQRVVIQGG